MKKRRAESSLHRSASRVFACENPVSAKRDYEQLKAHEAVWLLQCKTESYRVRLIPKMAAKVERLEDREKTE